MAIALGNAAAWAAAATAPAPALPTGLADGQRMILRIVCKPYNATINTPSGWTPVAGTAGANGTTASGIDTGSVQWAVFYRDWITADAAPTISVTSGNVCLAQISSYTKDAAETWVVPVGAKGSDTTSGTAFSLTMDADPGIRNGDLLDLTSVIAGNNSTFSTPTLTAAGATIGTVTEDPATEGSTATGQDLEASAAYALCTAGTASAAPVHGWTLSVAQTGGGAIVRLRAPNMTTLGGGTNPSGASLIPGGSATMAGAFTLQTGAGTDVVVSATVNVGAGYPGVSLIEVTNDAGSTVYGSASNPIAAGTVVTLSTNTLTATSSSVQYKIRITPKTHANMPAVPGAFYTLNARTTGVTTTLNLWTGSDNDGAVVTIDNLSPGSQAAAWTELTTNGAGGSPTVTTSSGDDAHAVLAAADGKIKVVISADFGAVRNDVWEYSLSGTTWTNPIVQGSGGGPSGRTLPVVVHDPVYNRTLLFGGAWIGPSYSRQVWSLSSANVWTALADGPRDCYQGNAAWDTNNSRMVVFGGLTDGAVMSNEFNSYTPSSATAGTWAVITANGAGGSPPVRRLCAIACDGSGNTYVFGGASANSGTVDRNDLWRWNGAAWTELTANGAGGSPPQRRVTSAVWDTANSRLLVWGGLVQSSGAYLNDLRSWDATNGWLTILADGNSAGPIRRSTYSVSMGGTWNPATGKFYGYGGNISGSFANDLWVYAIASTAATTGGACTPGAGQVTVAYTTVSDADIAGTLVLYRTTSAVTDAPAEGNVSYVEGNTIGSSTVGFARTAAPSTAYNDVVTGLSAVPYYFKIFVRDTSGNWSTGDTPTGSPATPSGGSGIAAAVTCVASVTGAGLTTGIPLGGSAAVVASTVTAVLTVPKPLNAAIQALSTALSAVLTTQLRLNAIVSAQTTITGAALATEIKLQTSIAGQASAVSANLVVPKPLDATATDVVTAVGGLSTDIRLATSVAVVATATAGLTTGIALACTAQALSTGTAALTTAIRLVASATAQTNNVISSLNTGIPLTAAVQCLTSASATLFTVKRRGGNTSNNGAGTASLALVIPAATRGGDVMTAGLTIAGGTGVTISGVPADWTLLDRRDNSTALLQAVYWKVASGSPDAVSPEAGTSPSWAFTNNKASGALDAWYDTAPTAPYFVASQANASSTSITAPGGVTARPFSMAVWLFGTAANTTQSSVPGTFSQQDSSTGNPATTTIVSFQNQPGTGITVPSSAAVVGAAGDNIGHLFFLQTENPLIGGAGLSQATCTGALTTAVQLAGAATAIASTSADLTTGVQLVASVFVEATASASLFAGAAELAAAATAESVVAAELSTAIRLEASIAAQAVASASLTTNILLVASATAQTNNVLASLNTGIPLTASVVVASISAARLYPPFARALTDVETTGWVRTPSSGSMASAINEPVPDQAEYVSSPPLSGSPPPLKCTLTEPMFAGGATVSVLAGGNAGGQIRVRFFDQIDADVGVTDYQTVTSTPTVYELAVVLAGTAVAFQLEVAP